MNTSSNSLVWAITNRERNVWSLGTWDGYTVVNALAQVVRTNDHAWRWSAFLPGDVAQLHGGKVGTFEEARMAAEAALNIQ